MNEKLSIALVILTYNESLHLPRALASVRGFVREVFLVALFPIDNTVELARVKGAEILQDPFRYHAKGFT